MKLWLIDLILLSRKLLAGSIFYIDTHNISTKNFAEVCALHCCSVIWIVDAPPRGVARLSTPGGLESNISSISPHAPRFSLIFPQFFFIFFLNLELRVGGPPTREGPGYASGTSWFTGLCRECQRKLHIAQNKMIRFILNLSARDHIGQIMKFFNRHF